MKKVKLFATIASLCLAVAVLCFGVFSATNITYTIGGTISYEVKDAFVKVNTKVYKGTNSYNRGELELVSEDFASGTKTLASENFTQDTSYEISEYDSTSASTFAKNDMNFEFSSTTKSYVVEMDIKNLSSSVSVWAIAEWNIDDNSNIVQGNNVMQKEITSTASKKIYFAVSVEDFRNSISGVNYSMNLKIGVGDYSRSEENLSKITIDSDNKVTPKDNISGLVVIPEDCIVEPATYTEVMEQQVPISPFATSGADTIVLPSTVESCLKMCVVGCQNVTRIVGVQTFGSDQMFYGQTGIFSARAKNLDGYTYAMCSNLQAVDMTNSGTTMGDMIFYECKSLRKIFIPKQLTGTVNSGAFVEAFEFLNCYNLEEIKVDDENSVYTSKINGQECFGLYRKDDNVLLVGTINTIIPNGVKELADGAFENRKGLKSLTLPSSIVTTGDEVFLGCEDITIKYTGTLEQWMSIAKSGSFCNSKIELYIDNEMVKNITDTMISNFVSIPRNALSCVNIESITIPVQITTIGVCAFSNCQRLKTINYLGTKAQWNAISKSTWWNSNCPSDMVIKCTDGNI